MKVSLARTLTGWAPADDESLRLAKKYQPGEIVVADIKRERCRKQWAWYWAMCTLVALNHEQLHTKERVHEALKFLTGHVETVRVDGRNIELPRETRFGSMEQHEADEYIARCKDAVLQHLLPGVKDHVLENEIAQMVSR